MSNVEQTLLHYAKNRGYVKEAVDKSTEGPREIFKKSVSEKLMLTLKAENIGKESVFVSKSADEYFTVDPFSVDPSYAIKSFEDFCDYVTASDHSELKRLIFPTFLHLVVDFREMGYQQELVSFVENSQALFPEDERKNLIKEIQADLFAVRDTEAANCNRVRYQKIPKIDLSVSEFEAIHSYFTEKIVSGRAASLLLRTIQKSTGSVRKSNLLSTETVVEVEEGESQEVEDAQDSETVESVPKNDAVLEKMLETLRKIVARDKECTKLSEPVIRFYNVTKAISHVICSRISMAGGYLAAGLENSEVMLCPLRSDAPWPKKTRDIHELTLPKKSSALSSDADGNIRYLRGHSGPIYDLDFVPSQSTETDFLLSVSGDTSVRLFDLAQGGVNRCVYRGHTRPIWKLSIAQSPHGCFATASLDQTCRVFSFERVYPIRILAHHQDSVDSVCFHPSGSYLATGSSDGTVLLWSVKDAKPVRLFQGFEQGRGTECLAFSHDGKFLACAAENRKLYIWDVGSGELWKPPVRDGWHDDRVFDMKFCGNNGEWLVSGGSESKLRLEKWKEEGTPSVLRVETPGKSSVLSVGFGCDDNEFLCAGSSVLE